MEIDEIIKPPLGIMPFRMWNEHRKNDIEEAIIRYVLVGKPVPQEWINELQTINSMLQPEKET